MAIDGGGIRGLIPAVVIRRMEQFAYHYAQDNGLLQNVPDDFRNDEQEAIHMSQLFDFTAGTSTGSLLAAGLAKPIMEEDENGKLVSTGKPKFWAEELLKIYSEKGDQIF